MPEDRSWRCDLCDGSRGESFAPWLVRCAQCGLIATHPLPGARELQKRYGSDYYAGWDCSGVRARLWERRLDIVRRFLPSGSILDVGCGSGEFLRTALAAGYQAVGTEFSAAARAAVRGVPVYAGPADVPGAFDAATLWHVLEHAPSPRETLRQVRERLKPEGFLFIAVPNVKSFWFNGVYRIVKGKWPELYTPQAKEPHLFHFAEDTLRRLLRSSGFSIRYESCDVPDADWRHRLADAPARALRRISHWNWTTTLLAVCVRSAA